MYIHCKLGQAGVWSQLFAAMGQAFPTVELPGHGRAPDWDPDQDYQTQARDLAIGELSEPSHIVGHSYGATVALRLAVDRPDLVRSLVLIEPVFFKAAFEAFPSEARAYAQEAELFQSLLQVQDWRAAAESFNAFWGVLPWDALRAEQQDYMIKRMPLIAAGEAAIVDDNSEIWSRLHAFDRPVLLMEGARSPAIISTIQAGLDAELPNAERVVIEKAGHMGPITHPKPFAEAILAFQQRH